LAFYNQKIAALRISILRYFSFIEMYFSSVSEKYIKIWHTKKFRRVLIMINCQVLWWKDQRWRILAVLMSYWWWNWFYGDPVEVWKELMEECGIKLRFHILLTTFSFKCHEALITHMDYYLCEYDEAQQLN